MNPENDEILKTCAKYLILIEFKEDSFENFENKDRIFKRGKFEIFDDDDDFGYFFSFFFNF